MVYPAVVYQRLTTKRYQAFGKTLKRREPTIQVDVYAHRSEGYEAFKTTASAVETALDLYSGGQVEVTYIDEERDDYEENTELFRKSFDIRSWYGRRSSIMIRNMTDSTTSEIMYADMPRLRNT